MKQYRDLLAQHGIWSWSVIRLLTRFPAAAAPIMFVMLSRTELGEYTTGAWMAAACVFTESIAAPILGARADTKPIARDARIALAVSVAALITLAVGVTELPQPLLIVLAALMGGSIAGLIGSLRVLLTRNLGTSQIYIGMSWDSVITNLTFATSPALVTILALQIDGRMPLLLAAVGCATSMFWISHVPGSTTAPHFTTEHPRPQRTANDRLRILARAWPIYLTSAAAMFLSGSIEISISPLLEIRSHDLDWAGVSLSVFSIAAVAGSLIYGLRTWPTTYRTQCLLFLTATAAFIALSAVINPLTGIVVAMAAAGLAQSCLVTARNLSLHEALPERYHSAGHSVLYSSSCVGFGLSSASAGWFADRGQVVAFLLISCIVAVSLAVISAVAERALGRKQPDSGHERPTVSGRNSSDTATLARSRLADQPCES
ncbi:MFS transporter [Gordonia sp. CPCC 206044]|uniref:MFS transporter n=1 Tax=Gordonia sp. CPCC 206044 TaxID=3140793 RepID=UPI003AF3EF1A